MRYFNTLAMLLLTTLAASAGEISLGVGVSGGMDFPLAQFDQSSGPVYGFRGRVGVTSAVVLEPNLYLTKYGDPPEHDDFVPDIDGNEVTGYGIDAALGASAGGTGIKPYGLLGIGGYKVTQSAGDLTISDNTDFGWSAGFGVEFGVAPQVGLDLRGKVVVISTEGSGSKKSGIVTGGIHYYFGGLK